MSWPSFTSKWYPKLAPLLEAEDYEEEGLLPKHDPISSLEPKMPAPPRTYRGFEVEPVNPDPFHVWIGDRDMNRGAWRRIGTPINEQDVGRTTFGQIGGDQVYQPQHHNVNIAQPAWLSNDQLKEKLSELNLPSDGNRYDLYKRHINTSNSDLKGRLADGYQPSNEEFMNIVNRDHDVMDQLQQANQIRQEKTGIQPSQQNLGLQQRWQQSNLNPSNWRFQNNPIRLDGTQVSTNEANSLRQWGEKNVASKVGTGSNPMTINNMSQASNLPKTAALAEGSAGAALGAEGTAAGGATFASRAMPMMGLALMAGSLIQNSRANQQMKQAQEQQKSMRT